MMRGVAAVAAVLLTATIGPAQAATPRHDMWVYGSASGYVDVTFASRFRPHVGAWVDPVRPYAASDGKYVGIWVESLSHRGTGPGSVSTTKDGGYWHVSFGEPDAGAWLPAGRYRVHFMTDAFSYIRVPVDGLGRTLWAFPSTKETVRTQLVKPPVAGVSAGRMTASVQTGARTFALTLGLVRADASTAHLRLCVAASTQLPCDADKDARTDESLTDVAQPGKFAEAVYVVAMPGTLPNGPHDVGFTAASLPAATRMELFTLTVG